MCQPFSSPLSWGPITTTVTETEAMGPVIINQPEAVIMGMEAKVMVTETATEVDITDITALTTQVDTRAHTMEDMGPVMVEYMGITN